MTQQWDPQFLQALNALDSKINRVAGGMRAELAKAVGALSVRRSAPVRSLAGLGDDEKVGIWKNVQNGVLRLEDIPGRRRPFIYAVEIPIGANLTSAVSQSFTVSQDGPFIATRRMCAFLSQHSFAYTDPQTNQQVTFNGRSNGRFRPVTSEFDAADSQHAARADLTQWIMNAAANNPPFDPGPGGVMPDAAYVMASNMSSFRTMQFDGYIELRNAGAALARQNRPVPTSFWTRGGLGAGVELAALDFLERGEAFEIILSPTHPNNPPYGNAVGDRVFPPFLGAPGGGYPFADGQYDAHEGIATNSAVTTVDADANTILTSDPVTRLPEGIFIVALEGYRIDQPPGLPPGALL